MLIEYRSLHGLCFERTAVTRAPRIAINCDVDSRDRPKAQVPLDYVEFVADAGGAPWILPPCSGIAECLVDADGILFIGGDDYAFANRDGIPERFQAVDPCRERADVELAKRALALDLPTLGVCGGFQLLVLVAGGEIFGDLGDSIPGSVVHKDAKRLGAHPIEWLDSTAPIDIAPGRYLVNSHHHQGVRLLPPEWCCAARSPDGLMEAAVGPGTFQVGVQWHPERDRSSPLGRALATALVAAARRGTRRR